MRLAGLFGAGSSTGAIVASQSQWLLSGGKWKGSLRPRRDTGCPNLAALKLSIGHAHQSPLGRPRSEVTHRWAAVKAFEALRAAWGRTDSRTASQSCEPRSSSPKRAPDRASVHYARQLSRTHPRLCNGNRLTPGSLKRPLDAGNALAIAMKQLLVPSVSGGSQVRR